MRRNKKSEQCGVTSCPKAILSYIAEVSCALHFFILQNTDNLLDAVTAQASVLPPCEMWERIRVPRIFTRAAAHEITYLHVPHGKRQISIRTLVPYKPLGFGQHTVEDPSHTLDLLTVADFGGLWRFSINLFVEEIEPG